MAQRPDIDWQVGGHILRVNDVAFSADGQLAASASDDGTLKFWDVASGDLTLTLTLPTEDFMSSFGMYGVRFAQDGESVWAASIGGAYQWRLSDGKLLNSIIAMESAGQVLFSPDGQYLALAGSPAGAEDATYIYRRSDGALIYMLEPAASVAAVFTSDSQFLIAGTSIDFFADHGVIRYFRISDGGVERTITAHSAAVNWIALSPDGAIFASCSDDGTAKLWNAADGSLRQTLSGHTDSVYRVIFSPDGAIVATSSYDGTIRIWDALTGAAIDTISPLDGNGVGPIAFSPDAQSFLVAAGAEFGAPPPCVQQVNSANGAVLKQFTRIEGQYNDMALSPDGMRIALSGYPVQVQVFDSTDGATLWTSPTGISQDYVAFTPDSARLAVGRQNGIVDFFDATTGAAGQTFSAHANRVVDIAFSPDGQQMATRTNNEPSMIWNYPSLTPRALLNLQFVSTAGFAFAPDSQSIVIAGASTASLYSTINGGFIRNFIGHGATTLAVDFSGVGDTLITASVDRTAKLWDVQTGATLKTLGLHDNWVRAAAMSPDGRIAATGTVGVDRSLRLWDVETGAMLVRYTIDMGKGPQGIVFSQDGREIYCGRADASLIAIRNPFAFEAGDVNADGGVDVLDAAALAAALVGDPLGAGDELRADVNRDGRADGADLAAWVGLVIGE
ncbi:MAG: WD40 repeat domain-containing protein [Phycisphaerales bacterium]|nr:WD40 repeat domain-containing protein [Phycisphaerales bacterium]